MKKFFLFVAALSVCALAAESSLDERVDGLTAQIDRVMSKAGIHFNGEFRSQFLSSTVDGDAVADFGKKTESAEYTSVDFDVVARPNAALSARAIFRLHQDWRNFFSDVQNPITSRWLSIDGSVMQGIFAYNLGDYKKKLTPLTLWSPDLELLYEPEIFAQGRELAMSEVFLGENNRVLQGANIEFKAEVYPILPELYADVFGARLATRGTGESAPVAPGIESIAAANGQYWDAKYDKYLVGVNLAAQVVKGAGLGVSNISIFDHVDSYRGENFDATGIKISGSFEDSAKFHSTSNNILAPRVNLDNSAFMSDDFVRIDVKGEAAFSSYQYHNEHDIDTVSIPNSAGTGDSTFVRRRVGDRSIDGRAINAGLALKFNFDEANTLALSADWIQNDSAFINEAAQSPSFLQRAILNNENDLSGLGLLNPFDAMYRSVFKYTPSQYFSESRPYAKNAYTNVIFPADKNGIAKLPANVFQTALPGGFATADRTTGLVPVVKLDGSFLDKAISVGVKAAMLKSVSETPKGDVLLGIVYDTLKGDDGQPIFDEEDGVYQITERPITKSYAAFNSEFQEIVAGASINIAKFAPVGPSLVIGGSGGMFNATYGERGSSESVLLSGFLNWNFYTRFSLLLGYQRLGTSIKEFEEETVRYTFENLAVGFGYKVADGGALTAKLTMLSGKAEPNGGTAVDYTAMQPEVYLTVKF